MCNRLTPQKTLRKALSLAMAILWIYGLAASAMSAPQGGAVVVGSGLATIAQSGNLTTINQTTQSAIITWLSFSVKPKERVDFVQPNALSITLNRVTGTEQSLIEGVITATGRVFLVNSNGILFSKDSSVNAAGFLASTLNITNDNFNAGNYVFTADGSKRGSVANKGSITARDYVALLGRSVSNQGTITATKGTVALASGEKVTLNFNGDSLMGVTVDEGTLNALVENKGAVYADGGHVIMTAKAADDLLTAQVNNTGVIQARSIDDLKGSIELIAQGGTVKVTGTLDASAQSGDGGSVHTSGNKVKIADSAYVTTASDTGRTGTWLIDSDSFTVAGGGNMSGAALSSALESNNVTIQSAQGDIKLNDAVMWSGNTALGLNAAKDIYFNRSLSGSGTYAGLALTYGGDYYIRTPASYSGTVLDASGNPVAKRDTSGGAYGSITLSGSHASLTINSNKYTLIHNMDELATTGTASGYYALVQDLDASAWSRANVGAASVINTLSGTLAGLGHTVSNLTLNAPTSNYVGLIGRTSSSGAAVIRDIGLVNANVTGRAMVGALLGASQGGAVSNAYVTATRDTLSIVSGSSAVGGLIGAAERGVTTTLTSSYSDAAFTDGSASGGLIGDASNVTITNCHATGNNVNGPGNRVGGLVGYAFDTTVANSYATGNVTVSGISMWAGGLIGQMTAWSMPLSVTNSFAKGNVTGFREVGGLIGSIQGTADHRVTIDRCYAAGNVKATGSGANYAKDVGGLIAYAVYTDISNSHATGNVSITTKGLFQYMGGLVGEMSGTVTNSYATGNVTGNGASCNMGGLVGQMSGSISDSHATGNVTSGMNWVGGLVGSGDNISDSWASGNVSGRFAVGGLAGVAGGEITNSHATGNVNGVMAVGGLMGNAFEADISNSYATGNVKGVDQVGGLVGGLGAGSSISDSYASGLVWGKTSVGGLAGAAAWRDYEGPTTITNSYWNNTGQANAIGSSSYNGGPIVQGSGAIIVTNVKGLTTEQFADLQYYKDGTIDRVLAERAVVEAAQAAAVAAANAEGGHSAGQTVQAEASPSKDGGSSGSAAGVSRGRSSASLDSHIIFGDSDSYSAHIKAISADGVDFELEDDSKGDKKQPGTR